VATWLDVITDGLGKIGVARLGDELSGDVTDLALRVLNRIFDDWNAERPAVYHDVFLTYTLTPALQPHTIGPGGTFVVTQAPISIEGAAIVVGTGQTAVRYPINHKRDAAWWNDKRMRAIRTSLPTDLYYDTDWPLGKLNLWPVPDTAYVIELRTRGLLAAVALTDTVALPPGYTNAIVYTFAEEAATDFGQSVSPLVVMKAMRARARIFANNRRAPRLVTRDSGVPRQGAATRTFNYLDRSQ
jgi:hypothetical protein